MELRGKSVFITGAAQGLGKGFAGAMLEKCAKVFFIDQNPTVGEATRKEFADRFGSDNVIFVPVDITDHTKFTAAFNQAVSEFGQVDIMVNNAGLLDESRWQLMISVNLAAVIHGTQTAIDHMRKDKGGKGGRIINVSSIAGVKSFPDVPAYTGTKFAVRGYTESLAAQPNREGLGIEYGIICPDPADTALIRTLDCTKIHNWDTIKDTLDDAIIPVSDVVLSFMDLLQLEQMNGAIIHAKRGGGEYLQAEHKYVDRPGTQAQPQ